jgi:hypothetical protein
MLERIDAGTADVGVRLEIERHIEERVRIAAFERTLEPVVEERVEAG